MNLGNIYQTKSELDTAMLYYEKALVKLKKRPSKKTEAVIWMNQAIILTKKFEVENAIDLFFAALHQFESIDDKSNIGNCLNNLATFYSIHKNMGLAKEYFEKALQIYRDLKLKRKIASTLLSLADIYLKETPYHAINLLKEACKHLKELDDIRGLSIGYTKLAAIYLEKNQNKDAEVVLKKGIKLQEKLNDFEGLAISKNLLAKINLKKGEKKLALKNTQEGLSYAEKSKTVNLLRKLLKSSADILYLNNKKDSAFITLKKYNHLSDSIFKTESQKSIREAISKHEVEKKDQFIKLQEQKLILLEKQKHLNFLFISAIFLFSTLFSLGIYINYKKQKKEKNKSLDLLAENKKLSENNKLLHQQKLELLKKEKEFLKEQLFSSQNQLHKLALQINWKNEFISAINDKMRATRTEKNSKKIIQEISSLVAQISNSLAIEKERSEFNELVEKLHSNFIDKLSNKYSLTKDEKRLATYLKLNLSSKEMSVLFDISSKSVDMKRYRLRKKIDIPVETKLSDFFKEI
ncbi:MAG: tetratricopeptide repeat protein [Bacteroidales bacterium]